MRRNVLEDSVEERRQVGAGCALRKRRPAVQARGVDHREVELLLGRAELVEQVEGGVDDVVLARARPVDLVDDDDRLQPERECLLGDEARLRHRPFDRVDEEKHRVDHRQHALDLAAEVGVAGRVDDVDVGPLPFNGAVLGQDRDAALLLEVVRVHHPLGDFLVGAEGAALAQQLVDQRRLAMVDVGDDGDVSDLAGHAEMLSGSGEGEWRAMSAPTSAGLSRRVAISSPPAMWAVPRNAPGSGP